MKRTFSAALVLGLAWAGAAGTVAAQKQPKLKETVSFAKNWEAAVEEAKVLNVPIVVHSHGFY